MNEHRIVATGLAVAIGLAWLPATDARAARALSEAELDRLTAGTTGSNSPGGGETLVANDARAEINLDYEVSLQGDTQSDAAAVNLVNATHADVASGANVWSERASAGAPSDTYQVDQRNSSTQLDRREGRLERASLLGTNVHETFSNSASRSASTRSEFSTTTIDTSRVRTVTRETFNASVPEFSPARDFTIDLPNLQLPDVNLGTLNIDLTVGDEIGLETGFNGSLGPIRLLGPGLDLGELEFSGDDIVVRPGPVTLPGVDFGTASGEVCVAGACAGDSVNIGVLGGGTFDIMPDFTLAGANPFQSIDLTLNSGFAVAGTGSISIGSVETDLTATIGIEIPDIPLSEISAISVPLPGGESINFGLPDIEVPDIEISATVPIAATPGFNGSFDGSLCVVHVLANDGCGPLATDVTRDEEIRFDTTVVSNDSSSSDETLTTSSSTTIVYPASMSGEAELIAFSNGELRYSDNGSVNLRNGAQSRAAAFNLVNATSTVSGNSVNVARFNNQAAGGARTASGLQLRQNNVFVQHN